MFMRLSLLALTLIGVAGVANAATMTQATPPRGQMVDMRSPPPGRHKVALTDEYGFHYDRWGNRLNHAGYVIAPPHTPPGAHVIQNGRS